MSIQNLITRTLENDGGTFTPDGVPLDFNNGYMVGSTVPTIIVPVTETLQIADAIWQMTNRIHDLPDEHYLGTWVHDGLMYIDASRHIETLDTAMMVAELAGELAIWDCANMLEIATAHLDNDLAVAV